MTIWNPHFIPELPAAAHRRLRVNPPQILILGYLGLIVLGSLLLKTPWATHHSITWLQAAFTATSAVTVTGLVVVDTGTQFTLFGQMVILLLIQCGGLGLMTFAVLTALALGVRLGLRQQLVAREALNQTSLGTTASTARAILVFALIIEAIGVVLLASFWVPEAGWSRGLYQAFFYSISAFNNAGFALSADSLSAYVDHAGIILTISILFITGGLGYAVVMEFVEKRRFHRLSVYSKLVLLTTLMLNLFAVTAFLLLEYRHSLSGLEGFGNKLLAAWFQSTTPRTAGFNSLDVGGFTVATSVLFLLLMFVGGAPNSTAGGIKLSTFVVLLAATRSFLRGNLSVRLGRRTLFPDIVTKALAIATIGLMIVFLAVLGLAALERAPLLDIVFEVVSAFGTVGLSRGLTGELSVAGQLIIMAVMFVGRVGPLTLGYLLTRPYRQHVRYSNADLPLG